MKRIGGYVLVVLGLTLVFLSPFIRLYALPRLEKAPTDVDNTVVSNGTAEIFSPTLLQEVGPLPVQSVERFKGDPKASTKTTVVINYEQHLVDLQNGKDVDFDKEVVVMDRKSGFAVHCCGLQPANASGIEVKFPFDTKKTSFPFWDMSANQTFTAKFTRTQVIDGIDADIFHVDAGPVKIATIDIPGSLIGQKGLVTTDRMYEAHYDIGVEPVTGAIFFGHKHAIQWAELNGEKVLNLANVDVQYNTATIDKLGGDAKTGKKQLNLVKVGIPVFGPIAGIIMAVIGWFLLRRPKKAADEPAPKSKAPAPAKSPAKS